MGRQSRSDVQSQKQQCSQTQADEIGQHISDLFTYKGKTKLMKYGSDEQWGGLKIVWTVGPKGQWSAEESLVGGQ